VYDQEKVGPIVKMYWYYTQAMMPKAM